MSSVYTRDYQQFLKRLKQGRLDAKLTRAQVSKCEAGERRVDVTELKVFAALYKKPLTFFAD